MTNPRMKETTVEQLLALNRDFYQTVATDFDATRGGLPVGWRQLQPWIPRHSEQDTCQLRVVDVGCGNGRFAWLLEEWGIRAQYIGVDADPRLLALAADHARPLSTVETDFRQVDFTTPTWITDARLERTTFDLVVCFAALHHVPSYRRRLQVMQDLASLLKASGTLISSHWQFLRSVRFVRKQIAWHTIGLVEDDVELGDALLPWQQGAYAVRYVHQTDEAEAQQLADDAALPLIYRFYADGKEGNLNLYTIWRAKGGGDE